MGIKSSDIFCESIMIIIENNFNIQICKLVFNISKLKKNNK